MQKTFRLLTASIISLLFLIYSLVGCSGPKSTSSAQSSAASVLSTALESISTSRQSIPPSSVEVSSLPESLPVFSQVESEIASKAESPIPSGTESSKPDVPSSVKTTVSSKAQTTSSKKTAAPVKTSSAVSSKPVSQRVSAPASVFEEYTKQHISKLKAAVGDGSNKLVFTLLTDSHEHPVMLKTTVDNISAVNKQVPSRALIHLGDLIDGNKRKSDSVKILERSMKLLRSTGLPVLTARGNHDDNSYQPDKSFKSVISNEEWYQLTQKETDASGLAVRQDHAPNFYYDIPDLKVRLIVLANHNGGPGSPEDKFGINGKNFWGFDFPTVYWLGSVALQNVPESWQVAVFSHYPTRKELCSHGVQPINGLQVEGILQAFAQGSSYTAKGLEYSFRYEPSFSFEKQGKRSIIGFFFGHIHSDILMKPEGIDFTYISTANSFAYAHEDKSVLPPGATVPSPRKSGTVGENCWDSVVVDTSARTVKIFRYGAGYDRVFLY